MLDTPIILIFFNRPSTLKLVFEKIKKVKPCKLFFVQDGPRTDMKSDITNISKCREIVENVDWDCEIHKNYSDKNLGCGVRPYTGITWAFEYVDKAIILEDDCIPSDSFFKYCEDLLIKYNNDTRISYISGLNHFEKWDFGDRSYGFATSGAIWGWATWKRSWSMYDYHVKHINDTYLKNLLYENKNLRTRVKDWLNINKRLTLGENLSYWDKQWGFVKYSQSQTVIVPKVNLINNIGVGLASTHAKKNNGNHRKLLDYNNMPTYELEFPLTHPNYLINDSEYDRLLYKSRRKASFLVLRSVIINKLQLGFKDIINHVKRIK